MRYSTFGLSVAAIILFGAGVLVGMRENVQATLLLTGPEPAPASVDLEPVWKAWRLLEERYVPATSTEPLGAQDKVWGMIQGLARAYGDPYTVFMPPREAQSFAEELSGVFGGVGIEIGVRDNILTVIAPLKDTPGDRAGLRPGDRIVEIDGESTMDMSIDASIERIRGEVGSVVVLTIAREGESEFLEVSITREIIEVPTIEVDERSDGVFVISLYNFGGTAESEMREALRRFIASDADKLVLDLRGNPGGYLESAVEIASYFLPLGTPVVLEEQGDQDVVVHRSLGYDVMPRTLRMAVLTDGGSASASEILAGALREHEKAVLIGTKTFGKGSVQELVDVTPDTSLKITVARWLTPNGVSLSLGGLTPDLTVPYRESETEGEDDPQLAAALEYVRTGILPEAEVPQDDPPVNEE